MTLSVISGLAFMAQKGYRAFTVVFITILLLGFGVSARANDAPVASDDMTYTQQNIGTDIYVLMNDYDRFCVLPPEY